MPKLKKHKRLGDNIHKFAQIIDFKNERDLYEKLTLTWPDIALTGEVHDIAKDLMQVFSFKGLTLAEKMMWQDTVNYMQNDILTKVDRASMAVSLETRVPFLDNEVFQLAWSLPIEMKNFKGVSKYPLRKIVSKYVPDEIMNKPKSGFAVPIDSWLRGPLRDWAEELLSEKNLIETDLLDVKKIKNLLNQHLSGKRNMQYALWNVLMLQQWMLGRRRC
jgi:asparagine synthase (glutamine-hydrolysing)